MRRPPGREDTAHIPFSPVQMDAVHMPKFDRSLHRSSPHHRCNTHSGLQSGQRQECGRAGGIRNVLVRDTEDPSRSERGCRGEVSGSSTEDVCMRGRHKSSTNLLPVQRRMRRRCGSHQDKRCSDTQWATRASQHELDNTARMRRRPSHTSATNTPRARAPLGIDEVRA